MIIYNYTVDFSNSTHTAQLKGTRWTAVWKLRITIIKIFIATHNHDNLKVNAYNKTTNDGLLQVFLYTFHTMLQTLCV